MKSASNRTGAPVLSLVALLGLGAGACTIRPPGLPVHQLLATPQTVTLGAAAAAPPHLRIQSGDVVRMHTLVACTVALRKSTSAATKPICW